MSEKEHIAWLQQRARDWTELDAARKRHEEKQIQLEIEMKRQREIKKFENEQSVKRDRDKFKDQRDRYKYRLEELESRYQERVNREVALRLDAKKRDEQEQFFKLGQYGSAIYESLKHKSQPIVKPVSKPRNLYICEF